VDPNKNQEPEATSHVVVPSPTLDQPEPQPPATTNVSPEQPNPALDVSIPDPQQSINEALREQAPNKFADWKPPQQEPSLFAQMNSPQTSDHHTGDLPHQVPPEEKPGPKVNKKLAFGALVVLTLVALPATIYLSQQQQTVQQQAAPQSEDKVVAVYNGQNITLSQVRAVAEESYAPTAVDNQALTDALDVLLERKILDREKTEKRIVLSDSEIQAKIDEEGLSRREAEYAVLRDKVTLSSTKNWQVYTIGFWLPDQNHPDLTAEEKTLRAQILSTGRTMLNEAQTRLNNGEAAFSIAKSLLSKYQNFEGVLAVNGFQVSADSALTADFENPKTYNYETAAVGQPFYDTIYSLSREGEVKQNLSDSESGLDVIQLVSTNNSSFNTYDDWLRDKKSAAVINGI
jgi:hypothetical protein